MSGPLKHGLETLQHELKQINSDDPRLQQLAAEVNEALARTEDVSHALHRSMQRTAEEFEVQHPQLTAILNNIMNSLSGLGI